MPLNFEFKARTNQLSLLEDKLLLLNPKYIGEDFQTDTYFNISQGRLKLREGNIENALIHYNRVNTASAKTSEVLLFQYSSDPALKTILDRSLGVKVVVEKKRRIYFIENVKFHFDEVKHLGSFIEVEAIDEDGLIRIDQLKKQCEFYSEFFTINASDYVSDSYSDLLLKNDKKSLE